MFDRSLLEGVSTPKSQQKSLSLPQDFDLKMAINEDPAVKQIPNSESMDKPFFAVQTPDVCGGDRDSVLKCPDIRHFLEARDSPFLPHNNFGGGFASDDDRVALQSLKFASQESAGAKSQTHAHHPSVAAHNVNVVDNEGVKHSIQESSQCVHLPPWATRAGARKKIYFDPSNVTAAVVTCGGLCPGLNDVVQGIVRKLADYGVPEGNILGIRYGFRGFYDMNNKPIILTRKYVEGIQLVGGTILGTSRGGANISEIIRRIDLWKLDMLFVVGGNGGNAGANAIQRECQRHKIPCSIIAVPKSIDNDILLIDKCFGFETAVEESQRALMAAKVEAMSAYKGIGIVKLMGRQSGFIAMQASMAAGTVDVCLIPEVKFAMHGPKGLLAYIQLLIEQKGHATICMAEGAGQILAHNAVHAAFAGFTGVTSGLVNTHYVLLPIPVVISSPRRVDPRGKTWNRLRSSIGMPNFIESLPVLGAEEGGNLQALEETKEETASDVEDV